MKDEKGNPVILTDDIALQIVNIRYSLSLVSYRKYESIPITSYVSEETVADILEHTSDLKGVTIEESTVRVYEDPEYFASIIGYTGKVQEDRLEELRKINPEYELTDMVGRIGIEATMETVLQGKKGTKEISVDSTGRIMETLSETQSEAGDDVYLTIDKDLQIGIYNLIEQQLAGILASKLVNSDVEVTASTDSSNMNLPIKDAYYQLINNNVLSLKEFQEEDASAVEKGIYQKFLSSRQQIMESMKNELYSSHPTAMKDLPEDMYAYMQYVNTFLSDDTVGIIVSENQDKNSPEVLAWKEDSISLREYLYAGISNNWIDTTKLNIESRYSNADDIFNVMVEYIMGSLEEDTKFTKRIYRYLVNDEVVTGRELCLALYEQEVLPYDEEQVRLLTENGNNYAYTFMIEKISNIEITPAQLALDPCTGSCVVTDVNTGEVRALVSYPGYDNNRIMNVSYFAQLSEDMSRPLYNNATQASKAPGSTFKPISAVAALGEGVITADELINCTGIYTDVAKPIRCWIYPGQHGPLNMIGGIANSCNYYFSEIAHRLSMDENGNYVPSLGIERIQKYAALFGFDHPSGIEITERDPQITTEDPERSSMGQGTHSYANIQMSRYTAALANRGTVFELSLIDKVTDSEGTLIQDYTPEVYSQIEISDSDWDTVLAGMRGVISEGSAKKLFQDLEVDIAGKTGTAQESSSRGNHAWFISYGPYENPDICVTVNIPYGYAASNAGAVAKNVYRFYYGYTSLDEILNTGALDDVTNVKIGD
ncbi:MAG: penicillin-binding transpeptidase domain-containing protein [Lachnospiraceae bacterium]